MYRNRPKYLNSKIENEYGKFDSRKEFYRYLQLKEMEEKGEIVGLVRQQKFELIPSQRRNGKCVERACNYIADFVYFDSNNKLVVEDVKGYRDSKAYDIFVIKRKLMLFIHQIQIQEI